MDVNEIKEWREGCKAGELMTQSDAWQAIDTLLEDVEKYKEDAEQLRVQLAGCGVAAMCNTNQSMKQQLCKPGDYGYSAIYQDVLNCVRREISLRAKLTTTTEALRRIKSVVAQNGEILKSPYEVRDIAAAALKEVEELC